MTRISKLRCESGSALIELAVSLPVLLLLLFGTADFARVFYDSIALSNAARAGAQYGADSLVSSKDTATMISTATGAIPGVAGVTASASRSCFCSSDAPAATSDITTIACTSTCAAGQHMLVEVTVIASKNFATQAHYPGIPQTIALSRSATMRVPN